MADRTALLRDLRNVVIGLVVLWIGLSLIVWNMQAAFIYFPSREVRATPAALNLPFEEVWIPVGSGDRLHGWWIPAADAPMAVLFLHGNAGNVAPNLWNAERYHSLGLSVLLFDYRGYGLSSDGRPSERRVYQDAEAAWQHVRQRGLEPAQILIAGQSLGGAIAIELARRHPDAGALMVESTFTSIADMARRDPRFAIFPSILITERFDSIGKIGVLHMPKLFVHGDSDPIVPHQMSEQLYAAAGEPKRLLIIPRAGHEDMGYAGGESWRQAVRELVELAQAGAPPP